MKFYCAEGHPFQRDTKPDKCPVCGHRDVITDTIPDHIEESAPITLDAWLALGRK